MSSPLAPVTAFKPSRRTRRCGHPDCDLREQVRTYAVTRNGEPASLCTRHWRLFVAMQPKDPRDTHRS